MPITVVQGEQRGDEGKGRFVDMLASRHERAPHPTLGEEVDIVARFNGANNAGHTVVTEDDKVFKLHSIPSGIAHEGVMNVIGNGTLINALSIDREIGDIEANDVEVGEHNLLISSACHLILPLYISEDEAREAGVRAQGSTKSGVAQGYAAKAMRLGVRAEKINNDPEEVLLLAYEGLRAHRHVREALDLPCVDEMEAAKEYLAAARKLGAYITDTALYLNRQLNGDRPAHVLAEAAQAFLLDIDHGMYPYVTSSSTTAGGVSSGLGVPGSHISRVIGVSKAVQSHVGGGPFATEIHDIDLLATLHGDMGAVDAEKGTTTGRVRRLGHLDLPSIKRAHMISGTDEMALTKLDWVTRYGQEVPVCVAYERKGKTLPIAPDAAYKIEQSEPVYEWLPTWLEHDIQDVRTFEDLPLEAREYVEFIEENTGIPITMIGVGPKRDQVILREK